MSAESTHQAHPLRLIIRNAAMLLTSTVVIQVLALLSGMLLTRHLKATGYGHYAFSYVYAWFLLIFINLGTRGVTLKELPHRKDEAGRFLTQLVLLRAMLALPILAIAFGLSRSLDVPSDVRAAMAIFMLMSVTDSLSTAFADVFRALEDMRHEAWIYVAERAGIVLGMAVAVYRNWDIVAIVQMTYAMSLCRTLIWLIPARRLQLPKISVDIRYWRYLIRSGWPYMRVDLANVLVQRADVLLLGMLALAEDTGRYNAAYTVFQLGLVVPQMLTGALQPTSARLSHQSPEALVPTQLQVARGTLILTMPIVIGFGAAAPLVMGLLFGPTFVAAGTILRWLILALPTLVLTGFAGNHLFAIGRQDLTFWVVLANAVVNVGLNMLLIPKLGPYGAVVATVTAETLALACNLILTWKAIGRRLLVESLPIWLTGMVVYGAAVAGSAWNGWISAVLAALSYAGLLAATRQVTINKLLQLKAGR